MISEETYQQGEKNAYSRVIDRIDEGLCSMCDCKDFDRECYKNCQEEMRVLVKWLREQIND